MQRVRKVLILILQMKFQETINKESKNINDSTEMKAASKQ